MPLLPFNFNILDAADRVAVRRSADPWRCGTCQPDPVLPLQPDLDRGLLS